MKKILIALSILLVGYVIGYYIGFMHPTLKRARKIEAVTGLTEDELLKLWEPIHKYAEVLESDGRESAMESLVALSMFENGHIDDATKFLADNAASYYVTYGPADQPGKEIPEGRRKILSAIEEYSQSSEILKSTIKEWEVKLDLDNQDKTIIEELESIGISREELFKKDLTPRSTRP